MINMLKSIQGFIWLIYTFWLPNIIQLRQINVLKGLWLRSVILYPSKNYPREKYTCAGDCVDE